jgi:hypothetical protein
MSVSAFREETLEKSRENRLRRLCQRKGWAMRKSRAQLSLDNHGGYMLVDIDRNWIVVGERFDLSLDGVESWLE